SHPSDYESGVDTDEAFQGNPSGYLRSQVDGPEGFGTLMQAFSADDYRGKRLRYSAEVKSEDIEGWAGLWMRVDGPQNQTLSFDNMLSRSIQGTTEWHRCEIVLDVPQKSSKIAFGVLLSGAGQIWINAIQFAEVGKEVAVTSDSMPTQPANLEFTTNQD
ncbi:MAG TPA: hypothetical protein VKB76_19460, partial [Ktedonobacterales bacterium]|nr:hypothetical protein [Ktedonobacterales bacterium]